MAANPDDVYITVEDYVEGEQHSQVRHEYIDGYVYAMTGASDAHVTITLNVGALLRDHLRGRPCRTYVMDMKVQVNDAGRYFYPDALVTRDERDRTAEAAYTKRHPTLIVEVVSSSTEAFDRGRKFAFYRQIDSLREYILIDPTRLSVDCYRRGDNGAWILYPFVEGQEVSFASVDLHSSMARIYEDVTLEETPAQENLTEPR